MAIFLACLGAACLGLAAPTLAEETTRPVGEVVEFGIFQVVDSERAVKDGDTSGDMKRAARGARLVTRTDQIPAEIGQIFGFHYKITGLPETDAVDIETIVKLPTVTSEKGEAATQYKTTTTFPVENGVVSQITSYRLSREKELVPGVWTFEHWYGGQKLVSQSFTVVAPK